MSVVRRDVPEMSRLTPAEQARLDEWRDRPDAMLMADRATEAERIADRRLWAVVTLTPDLAVARSILLGRPVLRRQLDANALRRALRGQPLPEPDGYVRVRLGHLDAVAEGGSLARRTAPPQEAGAETRGRARCIPGVASSARPGCARHRARNDRGESTRR